jgi:hypothetical protein
MEEAYEEKGLNTNNASSCPPFAIFSKKYYNELSELSHNKVYDYCFIGSISSCYERRLWVIEFAKKYFTSNSIFVNTDNNSSWQSLGVFDYTNQGLGFAPKQQYDNNSKTVQYRIIQDNLFYFEKMCQSKFVLCPAGDAPWSFRFYEVLMCQSIPIVESWHHTYRTKEEANINYKYVLFNDIETNIPYDEYIRENTNLFEKHHLL